MDEQAMNLVYILSHSASVEEGRQERLQKLNRNETSWKRRTSCTKKKSSPASALLIALGLVRVWSLHEPMSPSDGKGILKRESKLWWGFPAQLAPM